MRRLDFTPEERAVFNKEGVPLERRPLERVTWSAAVADGLNVKPGDIVELDDGRWAIVWNDAIGLMPQ